MRQEKDLTDSRENTSKSICAEKHFKNNAPSEIPLSSITTEMAGIKVMFLDYSSQNLKVPFQFSQNGM